MSISHPSRRAAAKAISRGPRGAVAVAMNPVRSVSKFCSSPTLGQRKRTRSWALVAALGVFRPVPVGLHGGGQGREQQFGADLAGQAEGFQPSQQVLLDPGEREGGAAVDDVVAQGL